MEQKPSNFSQAKFVSKNFGLLWVNVAPGKVEFRDYKDLLEYDFLGLD